MSVLEADGWTISSDGNAESWTYLNVHDLMPVMDFDQLRTFLEARA